MLDAMTNMARAFVACLAVVVLVLSAVYYTDTQADTVGFCSAIQAAKDSELSSFDNLCLGAENASMAYNGTGMTLTDDNEKMSPHKFMWAISRSETPGGQCDYSLHTRCFDTTTKAVTDEYTTSTKDIDTNTTSSQANGFFRLRYQMMRTLAGFFTWAMSPAERKLETKIFTTTEHKTVLDVVHRIQEAGEIIQYTDRYANPLSQFDLPPGATTWFSGSSAPGGLTVATAFTEHMMDVHDFIQNSLGSSYHLGMAIYYDDSSSSGEARSSLPTITTASDKKADLAKFVEAGGTAVFSRITNTKLCSGIDTFGKEFAQGDDTKFAAIASGRDYAVQFLIVNDDPDNNDNCAQDIDNALGLAQVVSPIMRATGVTKQASPPANLFYALTDLASAVDLISPTTRYNVSSSTFNATEANTVGMCKLPENPHYAAVPKLVSEQGAAIDLPENSAFMMLAEILIGDAIQNDFPVSGLGCGSTTESFSISMGILQVLTEVMLDTTNGCLEVGNKGYSTFTECVTEGVNKITTSETTAGAVRIAAKSGSGGVAAGSGKKVCTGVDFVSPDSLAFAQAVETYPMLTAAFILIIVCGVWFEMLDKESTTTYIAQVTFYGITLTAVTFIVISIAYFAIASESTGALTALRENCNVLSNAEMVDDANGYIISNLTLLSIIALTLVLLLIRKISMRENVSSGANAYF